MSDRFRGGIHPEDNKHTRNEAIRSLEMPDRLIISLSQHIGAPARPVVSVGDRVLKFQTVAEPGGFVSCAMHAPTSGTVKVVGPSPHPSGSLIPAVVIEPDGKDEAVDLTGQADPGLEKGPQAWKDMIRDGGIVGMGGAAFPTHVKLSPPEEKPIDVVIANGVECEPFLTSDHRVMLESPKEVIEGILLAMEIVGCKKGVIGIEANKPDAVKAMKEAGLPDGVTVDVLPLMYPQGAEKQLIYAVTKREVPSGGLPMDIGVVVQNVGTLAAINAVVRRGSPFIERVVTLGGSMPKGPGNYLLPIGTPLSHLVEKTGGLKGPAARIINGGPMMGAALAGLESPVTKGTSGILVFGPGEMRPLKQRACIRCGKCVSVCPASLMPHMLSNIVEYQLFDKLKEFNVTDCIECGCCSFECPADRNIVQFIRQGKAHLWASERG